MHARCALLLSLLASSAAAQFQGEYFSGTSFNTLVLTRQDPTIDFTWGTASPGPSVPADYFSVRWTGRLDPQFHEVYTFYLTSDDGCRLWVDGRLVINDWTPHPAQQFTAQVGLTAGLQVDVVVEFFDNTSLASCVFEWSSPSMSRRVVRTSQRPVEPAAAGFDGAYYAGTAFQTLAQTRKDPAIAFNWGSGAPIPGMPANEFSVRWTGTIVPSHSEVHTFFVTSDDGVRLRLDGTLVVDDWNPRGLQTRTAQRALVAGVPVAVVLEYFEQTGNARCELEWSSPSLVRQLVRTGTGGLDRLVPVGPFLDGALPRGTPATAAGDFTLVDAYPNLRFRDPLVYTAEPRGNRVYVGSRQGVVEWFDNTPAAATKQTFLDLTDRCAAVWDGGFLGLAFHPEWNLAGSPNRNFLYVWYCYYPPGTSYPTASTGGFFNCYLRLSRFTRPTGATAADPNSEQVLLHLRLYNNSHRGGGLFFAADGFLYLAIGDQYRQANAQNISSQFEGGVIRIDVDRRGGTISHAPRRRMGVHAGAGDEISGAGYFIPSDNPFLDPAGSVFEEFWTLGHRNPHRMTLDPVTQRIWSGEIGGNQREEINVIVRGGNYQWPFREGFAAGPGSMPANPPGTQVPPVADFARTEANAIIGGYVYRGTEHPSLVGRYLCGDYGQRRVWALDLDPQTNTASKQLLLQFAPGSLCTFGQDQQGEVYLCGLGVDVAIYKLGRSGAYPEAPALLSQVGVFQNTANLTPHPALIPYDVNTPLWTDGARKQRWIAVPNDGRPDTTAEQIRYSEVGQWGFPLGSVLVKHFETPEGRRLETRLLVRGETGWYGLTYRWLANGLDAALLTTSLQEPVTIGGEAVAYYYPSRSDCLVCHSQQSGSVLALNTRQWNRSLQYPATGRTANQIATLNRLGLLSPAIDPTLLSASITNAPLLDVGAPLERRVRSYLDANCAHCHQPGQGHAMVDARSTQALPFQGIVNGVVTDDLGVVGARIVAPGDLSRSILWLRFQGTQGCCRMPPIGTGRLDRDAAALIAQWIEQLDPSAATGSVSQSSTAANGAATNAIDLRLDGSMGSASTPGPTLTLVQSQPWWQADLGALHDVASVRLWNRTDCCTEQLADLHVFLSPTPFAGTTIAQSLNQPGVTAVHHPGAIGREGTIALHATGRYLRIQLAATTALSLAEVQIESVMTGGAFVGRCAHRIDGSLARSRIHVVPGAPLGLGIESVPGSLAAMLIGLDRRDSYVGPVTIGVGPTFAVHTVAMTDAQGVLQLSLSVPTSAIGLEFFTQGLVHDLLTTNRVLTSNVIGTMVTRP